MSTTSNARSHGLGVVSSIRPYPSYKPSGVEWLGELPAHWEVKRLKFCIQDLIAGGTPASGNQAYWSQETGGIPWVVIADMTSQRVIHSTQGRLTKEGVIAARLHVLPVGTLLYSIYASLGKTAILGVSAATNQAILGIIPKSTVLRTEFLARWFERIEEDLVHLSASNTQDNLSADRVREIPVFLPPQDEQHAIAAFLDRETAKIDSLVAKKERLIELLEEKRVALITQAVTRGLDPSVPMTETGIPWLGVVPRNWSVAPVSSRFLVQLGKMLDASRITGQRLAPYLRNVDIQWDHVNAANLPQMDFSEADRKRFSLEPGDLLVCEGGEVGRTATWRRQLQECYYQKAVHRLRPATSEGVPRFLFYVLFAAAKSGVFVATGNPNTIDHLTADKLRKHRFAFPPAREQSEIASFLDIKTAEFGTLFAKLREAIEKIKEFRASLISAAVTGKIDVRAA